MGQEATIENTQPEVTDNSSEITNQEPSNDDNSNGQPQQEPENNEGEGGNQQESKFKTYEEAIKGYAELEKSYGKQSTELGELRKKAELADKLQAQIDEAKLLEAKNNGFETVQEFEDNKEIVNHVADTYAKHLNQCEFPEQTLKLLKEYRSNPTAETLELIEADFPIEVIKQVAGSKEVLKGQLQQRQNEALENQIYTSAKEYLDTNVNKYSQEFSNPAFAELFGEAFRAYGCDLEADRFVSLMRQFAITEAQRMGYKRDIAQENIDATDEIAGLTNGASTLPRGQEKDILSMSEEEMRREIRKYR